MHRLQTAAAVALAAAIVLPGSTALATGAPDFPLLRSFERAVLQSVDENPPVISPGTGEFLLHLGEDENDFLLTYEGLASPVTQAHIHIGHPWDNGPVVVFLCSNLGNVPPGAAAPSCPTPGGTVTGMITARDVVAAGPIAAGDLEALKQAILGGATYVNVHSQAHPAGEIRGQINPRAR